jgi:hypothetical protein
MSGRKFASTSWRPTRGGWWSGGASTRWMLTRRWEFYVQKKAERMARRAKKAFIEAQLTGPSTIDENDDRWGVLFTNEETEESNGDNDSDASSLSYYRTMSYACNKIYSIRFKI